MRKWERQDKTQNQYNIKIILNYSSMVRYWFVDLNPQYLLDLEFIHWLRFIYVIKITAERDL